MSQTQEALPVQEQEELTQAVNYSVEDFPGGLPACLEAVLMAAEQPQPGEDLGRILGVDPAEVEACLNALAERIESEGHGYCLRKSVRGWLYTSNPAYQEVVAASLTDGQSARLSQAALEALAIVAYRQPITRAQVAGIRGVNSDGVMRSLLVRGLIREEGVDPETRAALLVTTALFLEKMGIDSVDQLPSLAPFLPEEASAVQEMAQHPAVPSPLISEASEAEN
ncbi:segregation and condensation protein B [Bombiscardovia apis]|uniref:Segregation and condensation protein B n=1 Tax=Bombiscardovia apis TaxID=2932182 RepID=A0ABM8BD40_9BIFI|nr:SMC-Scp complex subunit ScpB [Bombiscardovia apis]BDR54831.1 segregation and condensation protein B [Bombiscardovia apis]